MVRQQPTMRLRVWFPAVHWEAGHWLERTDLQRARVGVEAADIVKRQRVDRTAVRLIPAHAHHLARERMPPEYRAEAWAAV